MLFVLSEPVLKWQIGGVVQPRLAAGSTEFVQVPVFAASGGAPVDPTVFPVQFAFETGIGAPAEQDWVAGSWDVTEIGTYVAQCLVGPADGVTALSAGSFYVWVNIATGTENMERSAGQVVVF